MSSHIAEKLLRLMTEKKIQMVDANILVLGLTFKENCPDIRNTKVIDVIKELDNFHANIDIYDPWASNDEVEKEYGISLCQTLNQNHYDAVLACVGHDQIKAMSVKELKSLCKDNHVIYDVKHIFPKDAVDGRL
jgi:UDP-N-acetyl-D-galactosamine dehydrogenase